jgi:hypothetical protein
VARVYFAVIVQAVSYPSTLQIGALTRTIPATLIKSSQQYVD